MNNSLVPIIVNGYFDEKVNEVYEYKDNKFTFLSNINDSVKYIFEEIYITEGESSVIIHEGDTSIPLRIESNVTNFLISLTINNTINTRLQVIYSPLNYKNNFKIGDTISYIATKSGYLSLTDSLTITNDTPTISLEFVSDGTGNPEATINARVGFKSNSIGTVITLTYTDTAEIEHTETKTTQSSTGTIYFNLINPHQVSYTAVAGGVTKNDTFTFTEGERIITLTFNTGQDPDIGGNTSGGGGGGGTSNVPVTGINIIPTSLTLHVGDTYQLEAQVLPINASNKTVYWSIMNEGQSTYEELEPDIPLDECYFEVKGTGSAKFYSNSELFGFVYRPEESSHLMSSRWKDIRERGGSFEYYIRTNLPVSTRIYGYLNDVTISKKYDSEFPEENILNSSIEINNNEYGENNKLIINLPQWNGESKEVIILFRADYNNRQFCYALKFTYIPDDIYEAEGTITTIGFNKGDYFRNDNTLNLSMKIDTNRHFKFTCMYYKEKTNMPGQYDDIVIYEKIDDPGTYDITLTLQPIQGTRVYYVSLSYYTETGEFKKGLDGYSIYCYGNNLNITNDDEPINLIRENLLNDDLANMWEYSTRNYNDYYFADELDINFVVFSAIGTYKVYIDNNWAEITGETTGDTGYKIFNIHCNENTTGSDRDGYVTIETTGEIYYKYNTKWTQRGIHFSEQSNKSVSVPARKILDKNESTTTILIKSKNGATIATNGGTESNITSISPTKVSSNTTTSVTLSMTNSKPEQGYLDEEPQPYCLSPYYKHIGIGKNIYNDPIDRIFIRRLPNWKLTDKEFKQIR